MEYESLHNHIEINDLNAGDVLVFGNKKNRDSYIITYEVTTESYHLISLANFFLLGKWDNKDNMYHDLVEDDRNGYQLIEVIPFNELELRRINAEKKD